MVQVLQESIKIAHATEKHAFTLLVLTRKFFPYVNFGVEEVRKRFLNEDCRYLIASSGIETIGFAHLKFFGKTAKMVGIAVLEEFQGKGIGRMLLLNAIQECKKRNCNKLFLFVAKDNLKAKTFYLCNGFSLEDDSEKFISVVRVEKWSFQI